MNEKTLVLHSMPPAPYDEGLTIGDEFPVLMEDSRSFHTMFQGNFMSFTKEPDLDGDSYKNWFTLKEEK